MMFIKNILYVFFDILFNNSYQSHNNDNKKLNILAYPTIYNNTFSFQYCYFG